MTQMKAWALPTPQNVDNRPLELQERELPSPAAGDVLVKVRACGICRTDLHVVEGDLPVRRPAIVPGHQVVGTVVAVGPSVQNLEIGQRVGIAWLHHSCGVCRYCKSGRENLCDRPAFTGYTVDGGFAEYALADARFAYPLPERFSDTQAAPLLCAGIIGYRCLQQTALSPFTGARLGIYGFGAAGHIAIQIARARGAEVYVCTRDRDRHGALAEELGARWVGGATERPPVALDAAIIFAPAGELVPTALGHLDKGGTLVLGGIHMSDIPSFAYPLIYQERSVRSVANNTREDGLQFLQEAAQVGVTTHVETFPLAQVNEALQRLKGDGIRGAGVLVV
ncbi:MAG TPA: zinc-dependent alcohol dehydrogenase family protein [Polyangiaceae bacterium]|nr:zinc-dependent alcohol dehydrogenase family protein [Polyangiaceae bacterium]